MQELQLTFLSFMVVVVLMLFFLIGALRAKRRSQKILAFEKNDTNFIQRITFANHQVTKGETIATTLMTLSGGGLVFGLVALMWQEGIIYYIAALVYALGLLFLYYLSGIIRRRSKGFLNFESFLSNNNKLNSLLVACVNLFIFCASIIVQLLSLKFLFSSYFEAHLVDIAFATTAFLVFLYVSRFGYVAIIATDKLQLVGVMCLFLVFLYFIYENAYLITASNTQNMFKNYIEDPKFGWLFIIGSLFIFPWTAICGQEYWQRIVSAQTTRIAKSALKISILLYVLLITIVFIITLLLKAKFPDVTINNSISLNVIGDYQSVITVTIFVVGMILCLVTTVDSYLNSLLLSFMAIFNVFDKKNKRRDQFMANLHLSVGLLFYCVLMYCLLVFEVDLEVWFISAFGAATILLPSFIAALLNKYDNLASTLSLLSGLAFIAYSTITANFLQFSVAIAGIFAFAFYFIGMIVQRLITKF